MSNDVSQGDSNSEVPEVSSRYVPTLDDLAVHIKGVRESAPPLFSATVGSIFVKDWTRVMSLNLKFLFVPKSLKVKVACLFLRRKPAAWFERVAQPRMYRWNKFQSFLEKNFRSFGANWDSRMVKKFGNNTEDSSKGGLGRCEGTGPSNAPGRDTRDSSSDSSDPKKDPEEDTDGTETRSGV